MVARRLGIFYQRRASERFERVRPLAPRLQSAPGRLFIFHSRTARLLLIARGADLSLESATRKGSEQATKISQVAAIDLKRHGASLNRRSLQSDKFQPSICSSFPISAAKTSERDFRSSVAIARSYGTTLRSLSRVTRNCFRPRKSKIASSVPCLRSRNSSNFTIFTCSRGKNLNTRS